MVWLYGELVDKNNIEYIRLNEKAVDLIESLEKTVDNTSENCRKCMYRENESGYCWYTMATNKDRHNMNGKCEHFVNKQTAIDIIQEQFNI